MGMPKPTVRKAPPSATSTEDEKPAATKAATKAEKASDELTQAAQSIADSGVSSSAFIPKLDDETETRTLPALPPKPDKPLAQTDQSARAKAVAEVADADDEFENLDQEIGFGSFPIIKLDKHELICADLGVTAKTIDGVILKGRRKFLYKASKDKEEERIAYSYHDRDTEGEVLTADGRRLSSVIAEWKEDGTVELIRSRYYECMLHVLDVQCEKESHTQDARKAIVGELVLTSIAPSSVQRLAGYQQKLKLRKGQPKLRDVVTRLSAGAKITPKKNPDNTYFPWNFTLLGRAPADVSNLEIADYAGSDSVE